MGHCRLIVGLALSAILATVGIALFRTVTHSDTTIDQTAEIQLWDSDVEGYEAGYSENSVAVTFDVHITPILSSYCADCHTGKETKGNVNFDEIAELIDWGRVSEVVHSGRMPPPGKPHLNASDLEVLNNWFNRMGDSRQPAPTLRRLNRAEYNNTIRDLFGISYKPANDFPADDSGDGFDTIGDVLSVSPTLIEKYLIAADKVIDAIAGDPIAWNRLRTPPSEDYIPFVLRGTPPQRDNAVKGSRAELDDREAARAVEIAGIYSALQAFTDRAYRRPISHAEMSRLMRFVETAMSNGEGLEAGFKLALKTVLVSPHFLFKVECDPPTAEPGTTRQLNDFELASRLSYFLWSSMPDEELFRQAAGGKLHDPQMLVTQIRRMLKDPKSYALAENFAGQWLQTRALSEVTRDSIRFPEFDTGLLRAMRMETELFFDDVVREDRSIIELLTGDYTFVNERLAKHYGIAGIRDDHFRRVSLKGTGRTGVLMHAGVLTVTSSPTRTSPVKRGKWVLENIIGIPAPTPPPGVDGLKDDHSEKPATLREQFDRHRSRAECASCHSQLDPLGFGLENFDAVGAWRDRDGDAPIDPAGVLPDGRMFHGPAELVSTLAARPDDFARCLTQKLLTFAVGRRPSLAERSTVERIVRHAAQNGYRFSSLTIAIARSDLFQRRRIHSEGMQ